ncbi:MAG: peptide chain release factor N(5)-glutamine methyltransferase [Proteobacteria bacterium]|nr:peptide chain release factor N(5)-glutamine methyltransferase [Pseudomonadota bacterium]
MDWTPPKLVKWISSDLEEKGFPQPHRFQAEMLVSHALEISRLDIYLQHDKPCTPLEQKKVRELVKRRYRREPVAYIVGSCEFWTLKLEVGPGVLIPRPDTEVLVEAVAERFAGHSDRQRVRILELGTGSAAIPLALCNELSDLDIVTVEFSKQALEFASRNISTYSNLLAEKRNTITTIKGDKFSSIRAEPLFDLIISNPPYIPNTQFESLQKDVTDWEPRIALSGGDSGMEFYDYLHDASASRLKSGGCLIVEHGFDQVESIRDLFRNSQYFELQEQRKDYSGNDRVLAFKKKN